MQWIVGIVGTQAAEFSTTGLGMQREETCLKSRSLKSVESKLKSIPSLCDRQGKIAKRGREGKKWKDGGFCERIFRYFDWRVCDEFVSYTLKGNKEK